MKPKSNFSCPKILFLAYQLALILPVCAIHFANRTDLYNQSGWLLLAVYILFVGVDQLLAQVWSYSSNDLRGKNQEGRYYSFMVYLSIPAAVTLSVGSVSFISKTSELSATGNIGWIISLGLAMSVLTLPAGHELMHRKSPIEKFFGGFLFALVWSTAHRIEHIRGHHVHVATPSDTGFACLGQSFYSFLPGALKNTFINAWNSEKKRLNRKNCPALDLRNALIHWNLLTAGIMVTYYFLFGLPGAVLFVCQGLVAMAAHHLINYIQHYGLKRRKLGDGRFEKFSAAHAWSCNFLFSNIISFGLPQHADHHLNPRRPYPLLQHTAASPSMPAGYFAMFFMALIPPLWFKVMNQNVLNLMERRDSKIHNRSDSKIENPA